MPTCALNIIHQIFIGTIQDSINNSNAESFTQADVSFQKKMLHKLYQIFSTFASIERVQVHGCIWEQDHQPLNSVSLSEQ